MCNSLVQVHEIILHVPSDLKTWRCIESLSARNASRLRRDGRARKGGHRQTAKFVAVKSCQHILCRQSRLVSWRMHRENFLPVSNFNGEHDFNWGAMGG